MTVKTEIIKHLSGLHEIHIDNQCLVLTENEYQNAIKRGESVKRAHADALVKKQAQGGTA